ncbi:unnamed protein product [Symbiodinium sp. CCMP2456]|nr:unnamed protein product [Symbiodinium sp. CCMP2456]
MEAAQTREKRCTTGHGGGESEEEPTDEEEVQRPEHGDVSSEVRGSPPGSQQAWQAMELHMQAQEKKLCSASRALKRARSQVQQLTAQLSLKDIERARLETQVAQFRTLLVEKERRLHGALDALDAAGGSGSALGPGSGSPPLPEDCRGARKRWYGEMRVLVLQTPRLTYVQTLDILLRETRNRRVDLAVLPEFSLDHPLQCTNYGELSYHNVAIMMLARLAKQRQIYIVLGSVEERCEATQTSEERVYDTCVTFDPSGDFRQHRKGSAAANFEMEGLGVVGLLIGSEVEDPEKWSELLKLSPSPSLLLNPCSAPLQLDQALAKAHPELQVAAWHQGFRWIESLVAARLRSAGRQPVAFVRVDAPLRQGGAGQSLLVESHRSILCPGWDPCTFVLEPTLTVEDFTSRKLPKWRELTTEEILSTKDRELLKLDRVETGPRYHVWTFANNAALSALSSARDWTGLWDPAEEEVPPEHLKEAEKGCMQRQASALLLPLQSPERSLYVIAERGGLITLWDLRHRCAWQSFRMSAEASPRRRSLVSGRGEGSLGLRVAALGPAGGSHFAVAGTLPGGALLFQLFEVRSLGPQRVQQLQLSPVELPWHQWPRWPWEDLQRSSVGASMDPVEVRFLCAGPQGSTLVAIAAAEGRPEVALLLDLEGSVKVIDLYRGGPPPRSNWTEEAFWPPRPPAPPAPPPPVVAETRAEETEMDRLVMATSFEGQSFQEDRNQTSGLLCLWRSNRLCILSFSDWRVYDQMLLGDSASRQTRMDIPLCAALLPSDAGSGGCSLVVSYASMIIRWWQVSLHTKIQQACLVLHYPVTHLAAQSCESPGRGREASHVASASGAGTSTGRSSKAESRNSRSQSLSSPWDGPSELALTESSDRILVAAMDETRAVTLFLGHGASIERVYSVDATWGSSIVDGIWIMDTHFALLLRSGEVRHVEFDFNGELMQIGEIFAPDRG